MAPDDPTSDATAAAGPGAQTAGDDGAPVAVGTDHPSEVSTPFAAPGWGLLVIVALVTLMLGVVVVQADIESIADADWQENALWAAGVGVVLLGLALAAVSWALAANRPGPVNLLTRVTVLVAVVGVVGATIVVGVADVEGGEEEPEVASSIPAEDPVAETSLTTAGVIPDTPLTLNDAISPEHLAPSSLPIPVRTPVSIDLTQAGRELFAAAMGCRVRNFADAGVVGNAIGGTWAQPLLVVGAPFDEEGNTVGRCRRVVIRLPIAAGSVRPGL